MIKVGLIDDHRLLLETTSAWFAAVPDIELTHTAVTVPEYLSLRTDDDVVLLDLDLKDHSRAKDNVARLVGRGYKVLMLSAHSRTDYVLETLEAGAKGYLLKDESPLNIAQAVREVAAGTHAVSREVAWLMSRDKRPSRPDLSQQELTTCRLYGQGLPLQAVAAEMGVTFHTAKSYLQRARSKYDEVQRPFKNKAELAQRLREDDVDGDA